MNLPANARLIDPSVDLRALKSAVAAASRAINGEGTTAVELSGVAGVPVFLAEAARQAIEGQIYSNGADLRSVYRTSEVGRSTSELVIPNADSQIPIVGELRRMLDDVVTYLFDAPVVDHAVQIRVLRPGGEGHPRHVDYADAFTQRDESIVVPISLSLPISWNGGECPTFRVYASATPYQQTMPGSLVIFGPRTEHETPPPARLQREYLWLVTQAFLLYGRAAMALQMAKRELIALATRVANGQTRHAVTLDADSDGVMLTFADTTPIAWATDLLSEITSAVFADERLELIVAGGSARGATETTYRGSLSRVFAISLHFQVRTERPA